jgi:hypothetical protein
MKRGLILLSFAALASLALTAIAACGETEEADPDAAASPTPNGTVPEPGSGPSPTPNVSLPEPGAFETVTGIGGMTYAELVPIVPGEYVPPSADQTAQDRANDVAAANAGKPPFTGTLNGITFYSSAAPPEVHRCVATYRGYKHCLFATGHRSNHPPIRGVLPRWQPNGDPPGV